MITYLKHGKSDADVAEADAKSLSWLFCVSNS